MRKKHLYTILTLIIMLFIFSQSALPHILSDKESGFITSILLRVIKVDKDTLTFIIRKTAHFLEYTLLGFSLMLTVRAWQEDSSDDQPNQTHPDSRAESRRWQNILIAWGIGTFYAVSDELHQILVPGRSCQARDVLIDSAGVAMGILICHGLSHWVRGKRRKKT